MGDVVSLVEKAAETIEAEEAEKLARKLQKRTFDLDYLAKQLQQMQKMGGLSSLMGMLPSMSGAQVQQMKKAKLGTAVVTCKLAMPSSMTSAERKKPDKIEAARNQTHAVSSANSRSPAKRE